jgi:hypothetical protein
MPKPKKPRPATAALIRRELESLEGELSIMPKISALRDIPDTLLTSVQNMANDAGVPVESYAPLYAGFMTVLYRLRMDILKAQLEPNSLN